MIYLYIGFFIIFLILIWLFWKWKNRVILITHSGDFHMDELFSTVVLIKKIKKEGKFYELIRTRDEKIFQKWREERDKKNREVYIYDVGRIYDKKKNEFDHHQIGGAGKRENGIEYSSAGLVWKKFGQEIIESEFKVEIWEKIDNDLVSPIDALDNGQEIIEKKYNFKPLTIHDLIRMYFPKNRDDKSMKKAFLKSVKLLDFILDKKINREIKNQDDIQKLKEIYNQAGDKRFLVIEDEKLNDSLITTLFPDVLFVIKKQKDDVWYLKTVRVKEDSFLARKYFPDYWAGLEGEEFDKVLGFQGSIFCHRAKFIAAAKSKEVAKKMIQLALG